MTLWSRAVASVSKVSVVVLCGVVPHCSGWWCWAHNRRRPCRGSPARNGSCTGIGRVRCKRARAPSCSTPTGPWPVTTTAIAPTTTGWWQLSGSTLNFQLAHSCQSQWTATYDSSNNEFDNGTMDAYGPSCGGDDGTFWLSTAGRIDAITFNGTSTAPSVVINGRLFGTEPTPEAVPGRARPRATTSSGPGSTSRT